MAEIAEIQANEYKETKAVKKLDIKQLHFVLQFPGTELRFQRWHFNKKRILSNITKLTKVSVHACA